MSETEETIKNRYNLAMFSVNSEYLRGSMSETECQSRLKNLKNAMESEIERCRNIEKTHTKKKRVESPYE